MNDKTTFKGENKISNDLQKEMTKVAPFLQVEFDGRLYYGGAQVMWGKDSVGNTFGCGIIAATNGFLYAMNLYGNERISWECYSETAVRIWHYMSPKYVILKKIGRLFVIDRSLHANDPGDILPKQCIGAGIGIATVSKFVKGMQKFALEKKVNITFHRWSKYKYGIFKQNPLLGIHFIEEHLAKGTTIMMLTYRNSFRYDEGDNNNFHWVTITNYDKETDTATVSSWGEKRIINAFENYLSDAVVLSNVFLVAMEIEKS